MYYLILLPTLDDSEDLVLKTKKSEERVSAETISQKLRLQVGTIYRSRK